MCGQQTIDVGDDPATFVVNSTMLSNFTFCTYQFRQLALTNKVINIKVEQDTDDGRLAFMAVSGEAISKGRNAQNLTMGKVYTASKYERIFLQAMSTSKTADSFKVTHYLMTYVEPNVTNNNT